MFSLAATRWAIAGCASFLLALFAQMGGGASVSQSDNEATQVDSSHFVPHRVLRSPILIIPDSTGTQRAEPTRRYPPPKPGLGADVRVTVRGKAARNKRTGVWTYSYTVINHPDSPRGIWSFSLVPVPVSAKLTGPKGWTTDRAAADSLLLNWFCTDAGPNVPDNYGNVSPSPFDIHPGSSAVFSFSTGPAPGDSITYFVHGYQEIPTAKTPTELDSILETQPSFFQDAVTGKAIGPLNRTRSGKR